MRKRGRKSSAEMSIVPIGVDTHRPDPPAELTKRQAVIWRAIVGSMPGGWIDVPQEPLLAAYCRHVDAGNSLAGIINAQDFDECDLKKLDRLLRMAERESRAATSLATRMRLTQQAKMHPRTAARATENGGRKLWERLPWEDD